ENTFIVQKKVASHYENQLTSI
ncbi:TPA: Crp/Fnr family transcriptional regulator, partial [Listeria monocytogenes]|nr:Crp/Fnr family transcriptional regulator [Listeria monocytogenes]